MAGERLKRIIIFAIIIVALFIFLVIAVQWQSLKHAAQEQISSQKDAALSITSKKALWKFELSGVGVIFAGGYSDPSIIRLASGEYQMFLVKNDLASSKPRGVFALNSNNSTSWNRKINIVLTDVGAPNAFVFNDGVRVYYPEKTGAALVSSFSRDGVNVWARETVAIPAQAGYVIGDSVVFRLPNNSYRIFFEEIEKSSLPDIPTAKIYGATSDDGVSWVRDSVPTIVFESILEGAAIGGSPIEQVLSPFVINWINPATQRKEFLMLYTSHSRIFAATSADGFVWEKLGDTMINGTDPEIIYLEDGSMRIYYGNPSPRGTSAAVFTALLKIERVRQ